MSATQMFISPNISDTLRLLHISYGETRWQISYIGGVNNLLAKQIFQS